MKFLPDELLVHIMVFLGLPDMNKIKFYLSKPIYNSLIDDILLEYILNKSVKRTSNNNHVLIEFNPRRKMSLIADNNEVIKKEIKRSFLENEKDKDSFNLWIKTHYLKNLKKNL